MITSSATLSQHLSCTDYKTWPDSCKRTRFKPSKLACWEMVKSILLSTALTQTTASHYSTVKVFFLSLTSSHHQLLRKLSSFTGSVSWARLCARCRAALFAFIIFKTAPHFWTRWSRRITSWTNKATKQRRKFFVPVSWRSSCDRMTVKILLNLAVP